MRRTQHAKPGSSARASPGCVCRECCGYPHKSFSWVPLVLPQPASAGSRASQPAQNVTNPRAVRRSKSGGERDEARQRRWGAGHALQKGGGVSVLLGRGGAPICWLRRSPASQQPGAGGVAGRPARPWAVADAVCAPWMQGPVRGGPDPGAPHHQRRAQLPARGEDALRHQPQGVRQVSVGDLAAGMRAPAGARPPMGAGQRAGRGAAPAGGLRGRGARALGPALASPAWAADLRWGRGALSGVWRRGGLGPQPKPASPGGGGCSPRVLPPCVQLSGDHEAVQGAVVSVQPVAGRDRGRPASRDFISPSCAPGRRPARALLPRMRAALAPQRVETPAPPPRASPPPPRNPAASTPRA